jgi:glutamyl-tRNA synthetase
MLDKKSDTKTSDKSVIVRGRAAPSPTGRVHIGNIRTFLFNHFFLKQQNGVNVLRVEDTDEKRKVEMGMEGIVEVLEEYGITFDEGPNTGGEFGPYVQTDRVEIYQKHAKELVEQDKAYYCFCSSERLTEVRETQTANGEKPGYDRHCRNLAKEDAQAKVDAGDDYVIRIKLPTEGYTVYKDTVFGKLSFKNDEYADGVILKTDGLPPYNFAVVVDDHLMGITHAFRAREYLSQLPINLFIYDALGWEPVNYVHVPEVMNTDGDGKLSKRKGALPAIAYLRKGYLREALVNYLALQGWSPKPEDAHEDEIYTEEEIIERFGVDRISRSPARYDEKKLHSMNGKHVRRLPAEEFAERVIAWAKDHVLKEFITDQFEEHPEWEVDLQASVKEALPKWEADMEYFVKCLGLIQERVGLLSEIPELLEFLFAENLSWSDEDWRLNEHDKEDVADALEESMKRLERVFVGKEHADHDEWEKIIRGYADELEWKHGTLFMALRSAITGSLQSPPILESIEVMGWDKAKGFVDDSVEWLRG